MLYGLRPLSMSGVPVSISQNVAAAVHEIASNWSTQFALNHF